MTVDLVLKNGAIYTVDPERRWAKAIAIKNGKIFFVGSDDGVEATIGHDTVVFDLNGKMVLPGFVDAHAHPSWAMDFVLNVNLYTLSSLDEYRREISRYAQDHPGVEVIRGSGWRNEIFPGRGPGKEILDAIIPGQLCSFLSSDGHSIWTNSLTLKKAGITRSSPDPDGGLIEREPASGEPNGTLRETAMFLLDKSIPDYSMVERKSTLLAYQEMAGRAGITLCHDAMLEDKSIAAYKELEAGDQLKMRFRGSWWIKPDLEIGPQIESAIRQRARNKHPYFQTTTAKIFADGVIEGGTAFLFEPYVHKPGFRGEPLWSPESLKELFAALEAEKWQMHVHTIGDAAVHITLDALEYAQMLHGKRDSRHMLTHLQLVAPEDTGRFTQLGVVGLPQPFWFSAGDYYRDLALPYLGKERADAQYPMRSFMDAGVIMASSSDYPVTIPFDPLIGIQLGMTRSEIGLVPEEILWPEERVTLEQMIRSFTLHGAYANFLDEEIGSLEVGKRADIIILEQNLFEIRVTEISQVKVLLTMVDGKIVFSDSSLEHLP